MYSALRHFWGDDGSGKSGVREMSLLDDLFRGLRCWKRVGCSPWFVFTTFARGG